MAQNYPVGDWRTEEYVNAYREAHPRVAHPPPNPLHSLNAGNNRDLAEAFQTELMNYRQTLPGNQYLIRNRPKPEERIAAKEAEKQHMMQALQIDENTYNTRVKQAKRLTAAQRRQGRPVHHLTEAEKVRRADHAMYPRIITDPQYDPKLQTPIFRGGAYPAEEQTPQYQQLYGKTLSTIGPDSRQLLQRQFGEWVGLLGFAPEFHPQLLAVESAKVYLHDSDGSKYRYAMYDMDNDYRTPGTLWIYRRAHDDVPEEIYSVGGYIISRTATSKRTTNTLRDMEYYSTYPKAKDRKFHNKRDFALSQGYTTMKPVPKMFKTVTNWIIDQLRAAHRRIPSIGRPTYVVFCDTRHPEASFPIVGKVTSITWNAILSRITQLYLMYYVYPRININPNQVGNRFMQMFAESFPIHHMPAQGLVVNNQDPIGPEWEKKPFIYNYYRMGVTHPKVEQRLLNNEVVINEIIRVLTTQNLLINETFLPEHYMHPNTDESHILDGLTSIVVLDFTNNPLRLMKDQLHLPDGGRNAFIASDLIFRFATEEEATAIEGELQMSTKYEYTLTSKSAQKVYEELHIQPAGSEFVEPKPEPDAPATPDDTPDNTPVNNINRGAAFTQPRTPPVEQEFSPELYRSTRTQNRLKALQSERRRGAATALTTPVADRQQSRSAILTRVRGDTSADSDADSVLTTNTGTYGNIPIVAQAQQVQQQAPQQEDSEDEIDFDPSRD